MILAENMLKVIAITGKPVVIFLSGFKRSGKDTCASIIKEELKSSKIVYCDIKSFADGVRDVSKILFGLNDSAFNDKNKESVCEAATTLYKAVTVKDNSFNSCLNKNGYITHRNILDTVGQELKNIIHPNIWVHSVEEWIRKSGNQVCIIPDVRFLVEIDLVDRLRRDGYSVLWINVTRKSTSPKWFLNGLLPNTSENIKVMVEEYGATVPEYERLQSQEAPTIVINNDFDLCELRQNTLDLLNIYFERFIEKNI